MLDIAATYSKIDALIANVDRYKNHLFESEKAKRQAREVPIFLNDDDILKVCTQLICYSQNANSKHVEEVIKSGALEVAFKNFNVSTVRDLNPCDIIDEHWDRLSGIRQQSKSFHIVTLARKIHRSSIVELLNNTEMPFKISHSDDITQFWKSFNRLQARFKSLKIPFFRSTTSLLHLLLEIGFDCLKPDLVVMRVAEKLKIANDETGDQKLRSVVKVIQQYCITRNIRPSVVDLYFLVDGGQKGVAEFVGKEFIHNKN